MYPFKPSGWNSTPKHLLSQWQNSRNSKEMQIQTCLTPMAQQQDLGSVGKNCVCNVNIYICLHNGCPSSPEEESRNFQGMSHSKLKELSKIGKRKLFLYCSIQGAWGCLRGGCLLWQYLKLSEANPIDLGPSKQNHFPPDSPILPWHSLRAGGDGISRISIKKLRKLS